VERLAHEQDRRSVLARITPAGRSVARVATERLNAERFATEPLDDAAAEMLFEVLRPLRASAGDFREKP
jgi:DNA-binding MarR family transcriptional regulator